MADLEQAEGCSSSGAAREETGVDSDSSFDDTTEERETTTTSEASSSTVVSLLDRLRAPKKSELTRKRKIFTNPPREGTRKKRPSCSSNPKSVTPAQRVVEFPNECFTVSASKLYLSNPPRQHLNGCSHSSRLVLVHSKTVLYKTI